MDHAVALVQAYLRVNGYLTVTEYPVVEATRTGGYQAVTDLDILAFRFGRAGTLGHAVDDSGRSVFPGVMDVDPALDLRPDLPDMIIGEVKEGQAVLNRAATDRAVLTAAISRFGCYTDSESGRIVEEILRRGKAKIPHGHRVRLMAFGSTPPDSPPRHYQVMLLGHLLDYLMNHIRRHWPVIQASECKDPAISFLKLLEKADGAGTHRDRQTHGHE